MDLTKQRILVTGADGFIGSHLAEELVMRGCNVRAFVYYNSFNSWGWLDHSPEDIRDNIDVFAGDIRDPHGVKQAMKGCDIVMHLAALIAIPFSYHSPDTYVDTNVKGTLNIVQAARDLGVEKVIHTSTSEVYGTAQFVPITEEHPLQGQSPYSACKIGADQIAMSFYTSFGTPVAIIRPFNTYGPRQSARAVIPTIITQALSQSEVRIGNTSPTRDFTYVSDIVRAFLKIAECDKTVGRIFNVGSGFEISISELIDKILDLIGKGIKVVREEQRIRPSDSEVQRLLADASLSQRTFNWKPDIILEEGLRQTIDWVSANLNKYHIEEYNI